MNNTARECYSKQIIYAWDEEATKQTTSYSGLFWADSFHTENCIYGGAARCWAEWRFIWCSMKCHVPIRCLSNEWCAYCWHDSLDTNKLPRNCANYSIRFGSFGRCSNLACTMNAASHFPFCKWILSVYLWLFQAFVEQYEFPLKFRWLTVIATEPFMRL